MTFNIGDQVWWKTTATTIARGTVRELEDRPGVQPDGETGLVYLDVQQLYQEIPAEDGVYSGIDDISYHADLDSLSSSGARALLPPSSPEIFAFQRLTPPDPKPEYDFGHGAHKYVLGEGSDIVEVPFDNWRSGGAQSARKEAWIAHQVPLLSKDVAKAKKMADAAMRHPLVRALFNDSVDGAPELSGYWHDQETGVRLRFRTDWLCQLGGRIVAADYKTTTNAYPGQCEKSCGEYGYNMQQAWYEDGLIATDVTDDPDFWLIFQSKTPPFPVTVGRIKPNHVELGRRRNRKAIDIYHQCTEAGVWPGFGEHMHSFELPAYAAYRQEEELAS
ncbi:exonuclease VIII [Mycobacterium marinum]|uniref:PD-(D/E)XK nuclease-like domain-containing protein n=1 Tax=Mycobacterium marinum TaxID=1781 RepID=UPI000DC72554|nr:PD-(D/E)XK nuclease-like domain-containing protein [Mycobacterium marinum]AXN51279.1 exonuclease VIII [Mycobacterium marinum]RFZ02834.1 exonuclease VIII [Mycobacterium marinum]RFZ26025.1 exonuclease VIII [Mycobacterium marinum]RFZ28904.1 exonuclease VIII [Mycobacterium marinum]RFZ39090.1 exonuclease VIII [Mycobacterium marinum]